MKKMNINGYDVIAFDHSEYTAVFTLAKNDFNFNKILKIGQCNLALLKEHFKLKSIDYLEQYHSDKVVFYNNKLQKGDALITNEVGVGIGVFNADCVPILLFDKKNRIAAAIHSGWRGTLNLIVSKTIEQMKDKFKTRAEDITAFIGPHIKKCCFEVGDEVVVQFNENEFYKNHTINTGRYIDLEACIKLQLKKERVLEENIESVDICTFCDKDETAFSYRRGPKDKRMFSLIFIK